LFEVRPDGAMMPLVSARMPEVGGDLSSIIKYKGKTSELFTRSLISLAALESDFWGEMFTNLTLFDPMCGRGTSLFEALNRGWNAVGSDADASDIEQGYAFLKRYLEFGRYKHEAKDFSMTVGKASVKRRQITLAKPGEKLGDGALTASFIAADMESAAGAYKNGSFHLIVCDLPYGVQHGPSGDRTLEALTARMLPAMRRVLKVGGAIALSFNAYTLKRQRVVELLEGAGFMPSDDETYRNLSHWVEQAVLRDFALAVRRV
jgi:23S rRNA G2445 N2-methylase RlmL